MFTAKLNLGFMLIAEILTYPFGLFYILELVTKHEPHLSPLCFCIFSCNIFKLCTKETTLQNILQEYESLENHHPNSNSKYTMWNSKYIFEIPDVYLVF